MDHAQIFFKLSRGICQGDPLSPYIFIMCLERLSINIFNSIDYLLWNPIQISNKGPQLSHLFFADDIILLSKVTDKSCRAIIDILNLFTQISGQSINFHKSRIFFSNNCNEDPKIHILSCFSMKEGTRFGKYLGFPMFQQRPRKSNFQFLLNNFKAKLAGRKTKFLSFPGRVTLIKSTLSALPDHIM